MRIRRSAGRQLGTASCKGRQCLRLRRRIPAGRLEGSRSLSAKQPQQLRISRMTRSRLRQEESLQRQQWPAPRPRLSADRLAALQMTDVERPAQHKDARFPLPPRRTIKSRAGGARTTLVLAKSAERRLCVPGARTTGSRSVYIVMARPRGRFHSQDQRTVLAAQLWGNSAQTESHNL